MAVGLLCSGVAYLPFFTLIRDIGPTRTLSVGLLVPVLGVLWGWLLLGEAVTLPMLAGTALVLAALGWCSKQGLDRQQLPEARLAALERLTWLSGSSLAAFQLLAGRMSVSIAASTAFARRGSWITTPTSVLRFSERGSKL